MCKHDIPDRHAHHFGNNFQCVAHLKHNVETSDFLWGVSSEFITTLLPPCEDCSCCVCIDIAMSLAIQSYWRSCFSGRRTCASTRWSHSKRTWWIVRWYYWGARSRIDPDRTAPGMASRDSTRVAHIVWRDLCVHISSSRGYPARPILVRSTGTYPKYVNHFFESKNLEVYASWRHGVQLQPCACIHRDLDVFSQKMWSSNETAPTNISKIGASCSHTLTIMVCVFYTMKYQAIFNMPFYIIP